MQNPKSALLLTPYPALLRFDIVTAVRSASDERERYVTRSDVPMLPPFIIEQIRKREIEERTQQEQPRLELPLDPRPPGSGKPPVEEEKRGVIIVEL
jgi:hypothetical protein